MTTMVNCKIFINKLNELKHVLICLLFIGPLYSCKWMEEYFPEFTGNVLSNSTKTPIEGATVELINQNMTV